MRLQLHGEVFGVSKGLQSPYRSQHMGTDIMHLSLMPGSGKGYVLTLGLW